MNVSAGSVFVYDDTAMSGRPSRSKSVAAMPLTAPASGISGSSVKPPPALRRAIATAPELEAMARSGRPSRSKSALATLAGLATEIGGSASKPSFEGRRSSTVTVPGV